MKDELKYIDELYKSNLENYKEEAGEDIWRNMRWTLFWMRYRWIVGISSVVLLFGIITLISMGSYNSPEITPTINNKKTELVLNTNYQVDEIQRSEDLTSSIIQDDAINSGSVSMNTDISSLTPDQSSVKLLTEIIEIENNDESNNSTSAIAYKLSLTEISRKKYSNKLESTPDSSYIGYNRRIDIIPHSNTNYHISLNLYAGPALSQTNISGYNSEYLALRNNNETNKPGWSLGVDLKFHIKNWIISSGLNYSVYNQSRSYSHSYEEYSLEDSYYNYDTTWIWVFDPPNYGTPIVSGIDSSWVNVYNNITIDNSGQNQLKYLEIPIMVGYTFNSNMFTFEINAGVSAGFLVYSHIKVPDFNNYDDIVTVEQMNNTIFNVVANASVYYHINHKVSLFVSPYYKQNLASVFNNDYPVKQIFKTSGINLGISFRF